KLLLEKGAKPNVLYSAPDLQSSPRQSRSPAKVAKATPLLCAVEARNPTLASLLLDHSADPNLSDPVSGTTPLIESLSVGNDTLVRLLLKHGANPNLTPKDGCPPLARLFNHTPASRVARAALLLDHGADPNAEISDRLAGNKTRALIVALENGCDDLATLLLERGADPNLSNGLGVTALMEACKGGREKLVRTLLEKKVNVNAADQNGQTALARAVEVSAPLVRLLLKAGALPDSPDHNGRTPLHRSAVFLSERTPGSPTPDSVLSE
ncbi:MAG: ankyrin repeat domain-containing protein, partial [Verrucomicrobiota bacterium]